MTYSSISRFFPLALVLAATLAVALGISYSEPAAASTVRNAAVPVVTPIASGLHNPRGLNFAPDGSLYVAEAGGPGAASGNCGLMGDNSVKCSANTGSITRINLATGTATRVLEGLPSLISEDGSANGATGVHDISFNGLGNGYFSIGLGTNPNNREPYFDDAALNYGRLARFNPSGKFKFTDDLSGYEADNNPDQAAAPVPDSNPYGVLALPGRVVVADAGGNDLIQVVDGVISTLAVFPRVNRPPGVPPPVPSVQAVPTSVALGPDGNFYVGQLTGGPFTVGIASVYRVPAYGGEPEVAYSGFTNIIDLAFGPDGSLYVLEIAATGVPNFGTGRLVRIATDGTQTTVLGDLFAPGGVAVGKDGAIYVTVGSITPAGGVLKIEP